MFKKILLPLLLLATTQQIFSMEPTIDYEPLFLACEQGDLDLVKNIIEKTPNININTKDNEGQTLLLKSAKCGFFFIVDYLLKCGANKNIRNSDNHSLFSTAFYCQHYAFKNRLLFYTLDEINKECKIMPRKKWNFYNPVNKRITDVLNNRKNIHVIDKDGQTVLHLACIDEEIPAIVELLKRGASLNTQNKWNETPYKELASESKHTPFVIREAFNNGPAKSAALLSCVFNDNQPESLTANLLPEIIGLIKPLYINAIKEDFFSTPEARIWKPVCIDACKLADINEADENRCLTHIMTLPQHKKTEINLLLLKEGK